MSEGKGTTKYEEDFLRESAGPDPWSFVETAQEQATHAYFSKLNKAKHRYRSDRATQLLLNGIGYLCNVQPGGQIGCLQKEIY